MAKYKCIASGNVIEFTNQVDIDSMVGHEGYVKLDEVVTETSASKKKAQVKQAPEVVATEAAE